MKPNFHRGTNSRFLGRKLKDTRFFTEKEFLVSTPDDYEHENAIKQFIGNFGHGLYFNVNINDQNYANVSNRLEPGRKYLLKIIGIKDLVVTFNDCLDYLKENKAILVGAQACHLLYQVKEELPKGKPCLSLDEMENLWFDDRENEGYHMEPSFEYRHIRGEFEMRLWRCSSVGVDNDFCLVCVCDYIESA